MSYTELTDLLTSSSEKMKALQSQKQLLLDTIHVCDKRIEEFRLANGHNGQAYFDDEDSSDSDCGPPPPRTSPGAKHLNALHSQLSTCLQATQELTGLRVFEWEMNVLAEPPVLEGGRPVPQDGLWREVMAECRVDLVPFSISFYVHKPPGLFAPLSFFGLRACATKAAHARELAATGTPLASARCPSEAVQILSSYAAAARARRTTLASLADRYHGRLTMEALPDGGYQLCCAGLLAVSWSLQNKWSPIAPFQHRLKFDLEFMDESHIKQIRHSYRQLLDPSLLAAERTVLLAHIIDLCLAAGGGASATESDSERERSRTTLDQEPEMPQFERQPRKQLPEMAQNKLKDSEVMAPPKQLPRKVKPKGKENVVEEAKNAKRPLPTGEKTKDISEKDNATAPKQKKLDNGKDKGKTENSDDKDANEKEKTAVKRPVTKKVGDINADESSKKTKVQPVTKKGNKETIINAKTVGNVKTVGGNKVDANKDENGPATQMEEFISGNVAHGRNSDNIKDIVNSTIETNTAESADNNIPQKPKIVTKPKDGETKKSEVIKTSSQVQKAAKIPLKVKSLVGDAATSKQPTIVKKTVANKDKPLNKDVANKVIANKDKVINKDKLVSKDIANKDKVINKDKPVSKDIVNKDKVINKDQPVSKDIINKDNVINKVSHNNANKDTVGKSEVISKDVANKEKVINKGKTLSKDKIINKDVASNDKVTNEVKAISKDVNKDKVNNKDVANKDKLISKEIPKKNEETIKNKAVANDKVVNRVVTNKEKVTQNLATGSKVGENIPRKVIQNPVQKKSRIPQKKITTVTGDAKFRNPLRITPRKPSPAPKNFQGNIPATTQK